MNTPNEALTSCVSYVRLRLGNLPGAAAGAERGRMRSDTARESEGMTGSPLLPFQTSGLILPQRPHSQEA